MTIGIKRRIAHFNWNQNKHFPTANKKTKTPVAYIASFTLLQERNLHKICQRWVIALGIFHSPRVAWRCVWPPFLDVWQLGFNEDHDLSPSRAVCWAGCMNLCSFLVALLGRCGLFQVAESCSSYSMGRELFFLQSKMSAACCPFREGCCVLEFGGYWTESSWLLTWYCMGSRKLLLLFSLDRECGVHGGGVKLDVILPMLGR